MTNRYSYDRRAAKANSPEERDERSETWFAADRKSLLPTVKKLQKHLAEVWTLNGEVLRLTRALLGNAALDSMVGSPEEKKLLKDLERAIDKADDPGSVLAKLVEAVEKASEL
jgi:hypothetical protein